MVVGDSKTTGPSSRTRSRSNNKGTSRFIMEELGEINRISIQKNKDLVLSLNSDLFCFGLFLYVSFVFVSIWGFSLVLFLFLAGLAVGRLL